MRVLLFYTGNKRSIAFETMMRGFVEHGHEVRLLTTCNPGELHRRAEALGVRASGFSVPKNGLYYARQVDHLVRYCRGERIDVVLSQLQQANFIAVLAERLTAAQFYMFRHHAHPETSKSRIMDQIIDRLARRIVVLTAAQRRYVLAEGVPAAKVQVVPLIYDFDEYQTSIDAVRSIRESHPCALLVIMIGRLVRGKRHILAFRAMEELVARRSGVKLLVLDDGPDREMLEAYVRARSLEDHVSFLGYRSDVSNFLAASDVLLHPSEFEVSSNVVKEAGVRSKIVFACRGVGDFDDYLEHMVNAVLLNVSDGASVVADLLADIILHREKYSSMGPRLARRVVERYGRSETTMAPYLRLVGDLHSGSSQCTARDS